MGPIGGREEARGEEVDQLWLDVAIVRMYACKAGSSSSSRRHHCSHTPFEETPKRA
jgi:hypothetical protein